MLKISKCCPRSINNIPYDCCVWLNIVVYCIFIEHFGMENIKFQNYKWKWAKWFSCTLINVHAPTNEKTEEIKEEFYYLLEQNINQIGRSDIEIILGDFNVKVSKERIYKPTIGNASLNNETNKIKYKYKK